MVDWRGSTPLDDGICPPPPGLFRRSSVVGVDGDGERCWKEFVRERAGEEHADLNSALFASRSTTNTF